MTSLTSIEGFCAKRAVFEKCFFLFLEHSTLHYVAVNLTSNKFT